MAALANSKQRQTNWDLFRSLSMFMVVVVHTSQYLPQVSESFGLSRAVSDAAIICDPVFFMLSGYFALRPLKCSLKEYYLKKISSIVIPILLYSIVLYVYTSWGSLGLGGYVSYSASLFFGGWWFIPSLIPCLVLAPFLYQAFEGLDDRWILRLVKVLAVVYAWGGSLPCARLFRCSHGAPGFEQCIDYGDRLRSHHARIELFPCVLSRLFLSSPESDSYSGSEEEDLCTCTDLHRSEFHLHGNRSGQR